MQVPHVVIIGAGFGGAYVARELAPAVRRGLVRVTLVSRTNYFLFTPMLHEVATGGLGPSTIIESLHEIFAGSGVDIAVSPAARVDLAAKVVQADGRSFPYDRLVIATGATTDFRGVAGAAEHAMGLKDAREAYFIREKVIKTFEARSMKRDARPVSIAVVGGGPTGVELAGEMVDFARGIAERYHRHAPGTHPRPDQVVEIHLIHAGVELLEQLPAKIRAAALEALQKKGVMVQLGAFVKEVRADAVVLPERAVATDVVIWTAGVKPQLPEFAQMPAFTGNRLTVDAQFRLVGHDDAFALGDAAAVPGGDGRPLPMLAQVATEQSKTLAQNIIASVTGRTLRTFRYDSKGVLVSIGQWFAVGEVMHGFLQGKFAWWLWRTVYLFKFFSWRKRLRIAFEWTLGIFTARDVTSLS